VNVEFPPIERVNLFGDFSRGELVGAALATTVFGLGIMVGQLVPAVAVLVVILLWTFTPTRRRPFRVIVPSAVRWTLRRDRLWTAPMRGASSGPTFLRGMDVHLVDGHLGGSAPVGVVAWRRSYTVMFTVDRAALTFSSETEQDQALDGWGKVLGALCVERQTELTAERVGWTDLHRAADPAALVRHHELHGVAGPASADYGEHLTTFGTLAAEHDVVVWATVTQAGRYRLAKRSGMRGSITEVMHAAAMRAGETLCGELADRGFTVGPLMSPVDIGRLVTHGMDPYQPLESLTGRERFALAERTMPESQVTVERDGVTVDRAYHRVFAVQWPSVAVHASWLWKPLAIDGPKIVTTVFEPVPPSRADRQRNSRRSIGSRNNAAASTEGDGHVRVKNVKKVDALQRAERAVSEGHGELDAFMLIVISASSRAELDRRCHTLRRKLRECGHASVREMSGEHDRALAAALPLGMRVGAENS
jgi:hypothetical protein